MKRFAPAMLALSLVLLLGPNAFAAEPQPSPAGTAVPASWLKGWNDPALADRPLQIIHGIRLRGTPANGRGLDEANLRRLALETMQSYKDLGLGGVVANVAFNDYLQSEENWKILVAGVEACQKLGLTVWLYDEEGYPSGAAGGLVLKENRQFEALELAYDPAQSDPFVLRPSYEHTHASNNYNAARRYVNLIDDRAVKTFTEKTHEAYRKRLSQYFGGTVQAFFTDEPSLIAVNLGQLPASVRSAVRVVDPPDPNVPSLPVVPWSYDLPKQYQKRYGEDLMAVRRSLFTGDTTADRRVRQQFWGLIADLMAQRYFGVLQEWCARNRLASSGHTLWEEAILHHPALEGNALKMLSRMDIPGLDMLSSNPEAVIYSGWLTAALPSSAALLAGRRRVMTEISDFSEKMGALGPASLDLMRAAAAWQAAWGVTEFTLYYSTNDRTAEQYRAYNETVGRLNAVLKPAQWDPEVLLYYPVRDLWAEYLPVAGPLDVTSQSARTQRIVRSFMHLGQSLQRNQVSFALIDHEFLASASAQDGKLGIQGRSFKTLVLPESVELPPETAKVVEQFRKSGGRVVEDGQGGAPISAKNLVLSVNPAHRLVPGSERITLGRFLREGRHVLVLANAAEQPYQGELTAGPGTWSVLDPANGSIRPAKTNASGRLAISLAARQTLLLVEGK